MFFLDQKAVDFGFKSGSSDRAGRLVNIASKSAILYYFTSVLTASKPRSSTNIFPPLEKANEGAYSCALLLAIFA